MDNSKLNTVCKPILSHEIGGQNDLIDRMWYEIGDHLGLAANQIGSTKRIFILNYAGNKLELINPMITQYRGGKNTELEQCLSFPGQEVLVERWKIIRIQGYSRDWKLQKFKFRGLLARICQHEIDHLDGITMFDRRKK